MSFCVHLARSGITDNLTFLSKAGQRDLILLLIAGHGINGDRGISIPSQTTRAARMTRPASDHQKAGRQCELIME